MNHSTTSKALAHAERSTHYKLARQMGDTYTILDVAERACHEPQGLTISNGLG
jgi:hypothetical protein